MVRRTLGFELQTDPPHHYFSGVLVDGADDFDQELQAIGTEGDVHFLAFPQGAGRVRLYLGFGLDQPKRFTGPDGPQAFVDAFRVRLHAGVRGAGVGDAGQPVRDLPQRGHVGRRAGPRRRRAGRRRRRLERPDHRPGPVDRAARRAHRQRAAAGVGRLVGGRVRALRRGAARADAPAALRGQRAVADLQRVRTGGRGPPACACGSASRPSPSCHSPWSPASSAPSWRRPTCSPTTPGTASSTDVRSVPDPQLFGVADGIRPPHRTVRRSGRSYDRTRPR